MTLRQRVAMIRSEMRTAMAEGKMSLYLELVEELAIVLNPRNQ